MKNLEPVTVRLPKTLTRRLRIHAASTGKSIQEIVKLALEVQMRKGGSHA